MLVFPGLLASFLHNKLMGEWLEVILSLPIIFSSQILYSIFFPGYKSIIAIHPHSNWNVWSMAEFYKIYKCLWSNWIDLLFCIRWKHHPSHWYFTHHTLRRLKTFLEMIFDLYLFFRVAHWKITILEFGKSSLLFIFIIYIYYKGSLSVIFHLFQAFLGTFATARGSKHLLQGVSVDICRAKHGTHAAGGAS